jgi:hypothetical protein
LADRPSPKSIDGEILGPEHAYDNPELSPKEFLLAVMRDNRLPIAARMDAAAKVAVYEHPRLAQVNTDLTAGVTIRIEGGLPELPGTNIIMPEIQKAPKKSTNGSGQP